jgi:hypothetical protein
MIKRHCEERKQNRHLKRGRGKKKKCVETYIGRFSKVNVRSLFSKKKHNYLKSDLYQAQNCTSWKRSNDSVAVFVINGPCCLSVVATVNIKYLEFCFLLCSGCGRSSGNFMPFSL